MPTDRAVRLTLAGLVLLLLAGLLAVAWWARG
jgi:hypothetical protein